MTCRFPVFYCKLKYLFCVGGFERFLNDINQKLLGMDSFTKDLWMEKGMPSEQAMYCKLKF